MSLTRNETISLCVPAVSMDPLVYEVEVELNVTDVSTVDNLRNLLNNNSFSLTLNSTVNVTHINVTTGKQGYFHKNYFLLSVQLCVSLTNYRSS